MTYKQLPNGVGHLTTDPTHLDDRKVALDQILTLLSGFVVCVSARRTLLQHVYFFAPYRGTG